DSEPGTPDPSPKGSCALLLPPLTLRRTPCTVLAYGPTCTLPDVTMKRALIRRPSPRIADGIVTHIERQPVDFTLAREQWDGYVRAVEAAGWETIEVPGGEEFPDGAFIEATMVVYRDLEVKVRPGTVARHAAVLWVVAVACGQVV